MRAGGERIEKTVGRNIGCAVFIDGRNPTYRSRCDDRLERVKGKSMIGGVVAVHRSACLFETKKIISGSTLSMEYYCSRNGNMLLLGYAHLCETNVTGILGVETRTP